MMQNFYRATDYSNDYLVHHGVPGQKHGVRNYQYLDGSLTPEGRIHYGVGPARTRTRVLTSHGKRQQAKKMVGAALSGDTKSAKKSYQVLKRNSQVQKAYNKAKRAEEKEAEEKKRAKEERTAEKKRVQEQEAKRQEKEAAKAEQEKKRQQVKELKKEIKAAKKEEKETQKVEDLKEQYRKDPSLMLKNADLFTTEELIDAHKRNVALGNIHSDKVEKLQRGATIANTILNYGKVAVSAAQEVEKAYNVYQTLTSNQNGNKSHQNKNQQSDKKDKQSNQSNNQQTKKDNNQSNKQNQNNNLPSSKDFKEMVQKQASQEKEMKEMISKVDSLLQQLTTSQFEENPNWTLSGGGKVNFFTAAETHTDSSKKNKKK